MYVFIYVCMYEWMKKLKMADAQNNYRKNDATALIKTMTRE